MTFRLSERMALMLALALAVMAEPAQAQSLPTYWGEVDQDEMALVTIIEPSPTFGGGWVTLTEEETLLDASYWSGALPFIRQHRLEPVEYEIFTEGEEPSFTLAAPAGSITLVTWDIVDPEEGSLRDVKPPLTLDPGEAGDAIASDYGDVLAEGIGHDVTKLRPETTSLRLTLVPDRRPPPRP